MVLFVRRWSVRLVSVVGLVPASVDEEAVQFWRTIGLGLGAIVLALGLLCRFVLWASWETTFHPAVDRRLPGYTTQSTVIRVVPRGIDGNPQFPYAVWTRSGGKFTFRFDPHARVGDQLTAHWDAGRWLLWDRVHGRTFSVVYGFALAALAASLGSAGLWFLAVLIAIWCILLAGRISRDLHAVPEDRVIHVERVWFPRARLTAVPLFVRDAQTGKYLTVYAPSAFLPNLHSGPLHVTVAPHTGLISTVSGGNGAPVRTDGTVVQHLDRLPYAQFLWAPSLASLAETLHASVRRFQVAISVFLLLLSWLTVPLLMPLSMPRYTVTPVVTGVTLPYTIEPSGYPYEIRSGLARYLFSVDPKVHPGDRIAVQYTIFHQLVKIDANGVVIPNRTLHNQPASLLALLLSTFLYAAYSVRRALPRLTRSRTEPATV